MELTAKLACSFDVDKLHPGDKIVIDPGEPETARGFHDDAPYQPTRKPRAFMTFQKPEGGTYTFQVDLSKSVPELRNTWKRQQLADKTRRDIQAEKGNLKDALAKSNVPYTMYEAMGRTKNFWKNYEADFTKLQRMGLVDSSIKFSGKDKSTKEQAATGNAMMKAVRELAGKVGGKLELVGAWLAEDGEKISLLSFEKRAGLTNEQFRTFTGLKGLVLRNKSKLGLFFKATEPGKEGYQLEVKEAGTTPVTNSYGVEFLPNGVIKVRGAAGNEGFVSLSPKTKVDEFIALVKKI
jgi:hypothetical protein